MKIYLLKVGDIFQPKSQIFVYPKSNIDFGIEQDFHNFLKKSNFLVNDPQKADWHYLPVYWTRWHLNHDYGRTGLLELIELVDKVIIDDKKTFTVCQYDDGPLVGLGETKLFLASRKSSEGFDVPLLSKLHRKPIFKPSKHFKASFVGRLSTHPIRTIMSSVLSDREDVIVLDEEFSSEKYVEFILKSYIALAPRGYGGSSFRFFEAMQLGIVPLLIGDIDTRPFKKFLPWDDVSIYVDNPDCLIDALNKWNIMDLKIRGTRASEFYKHHLGYGKWCKYVLIELMEGI
jgi:hypothetical protein